VKASVVSYMWLSASKTVKSITRAMVMLLLLLLCVWISARAARVVQAAVPRGSDGAGAGP
jgi:hypothetical protein